MIISKLAQLCLQFLEQDAETNVTATDINTLQADDTFAEYLINMEHSIYMGLVRYATSRILPLKEISFEKGTNRLRVVDNAGRRLFHAIKEVYAEDKDGNISSNIPYYIIGDKVVLKSFNKDLTYNVIYHPTINELSTYTDENSIWNIDLYETLGVPDEMAINIKYLVYSDMKVEESPNMANQCKNIFESYLEQMATNQVVNNQVEYTTFDWSDTYGN